MSTAGRASKRLGESATVVTPCSSRAPSPRVSEQLGLEGWCRRLRALREQRYGSSGGVCFRSFRAQTPGFIQTLGSSKIPAGDATIEWDP